MTARESYSSPKVSPALSGQIASPSRRGFLAGLGLILAAPAIVKVTSLMPVKALPSDLLSLDEFSTKILQPMIDEMAETVAANIINGNNLLTINAITREAVKHFRNSNRFISEVNAQFNKEFGFVNGSRWGNQLRIRLPQGKVPRLQKHGWA